MIKELLTALRPKTDFSKRIKSRHRVFWQPPDAELIRNTPMSATDPIEKWRDVTYWQRKLSNKHNSREFAKMHGCKVPDLYWKGRNIDELPFDELPQNYVIRPTIGHSCNSVFVMKDGLNLFDKKSYTTSEIQACLRTNLNNNVQLEFLVEEFLVNEDGKYDILTDYKFYAFNGNIAAILVINRLSPKTGFQTAYTERWMPTSELVTSYPKGELQNPPACFKEMVEGVKKLSKAYEIFVRVDYYATNKGAVFGEFSPTPSLGNNSTPFARKLFKSFWAEHCTNMV